MELNREQIIKALECCRHSDSSEEYCADCPYYTVKYCAAKISEDALSLIKELTVELEAMRGAANSYKMHNEKLTEENERLSQSLANSKSILANSKADTVKKMQERLKPYEDRLSCHFCKHSLKGDRNEKCDNAIQCYAWKRWESVIDQIAKEMLEGEDGH